MKSAARITSVPAARATLLAGPAPRRWTRSEFYSLIEKGFFDGQRVELIEGEIIQMAQMKGPHWVGIGLAEKALRRIFGQGFVIRTQSPLHLLRRSAPAPDAVVVLGSERDFMDHPTTALLVLEVSDSTLYYDRGPKGSLYAKAKLADYWIVNLVDRLVEIHRRPIPDRSQLFKYRYADVQKLGPSDFASPLAAPKARIKVADLLP